MVSLSPSHVFLKICGIDVDVSPIINNIYFIAIAILIKVEKEVDMS